MKSKTDSKEDNGVFLHIFRQADQALLIPPDQDAAAGRQAV